MATSIQGTKIVFNDATEQLSAGGGWSGITQFTANGTYTSSANTTKVMIAIIGGGGGGGGGFVNGGGNTGGTGGFGVGCFTVTPSTAYTVTIGNGGNGGTASNNSFNPPNTGNAGNASSVGNLITANAGTGSANGTCPNSNVSGLVANERPNMATLLLSGGNIYLGYGGGGGNSWSENAVATNGSVGGKGAVTIYWN